MMPEPAVSRVLVRVEFADGSVREMEALNPHSVEWKADLPDLSPWPLLASPLWIPPGPAAGVTMTFKPSGRPAEPMTIRHGTPAS